MSSPSYEYKETILNVTGVSLTLGGTPVLRDLNLEVKDVYRPGLTQGQVVGLLGPSGIGKTCLFRILAGLSAHDPEAARRAAAEHIKAVGEGILRLIGGGKIT